MLVFTRPLYHSLPKSDTAWPRVVTASFVGFVSTWTVVYDNGTHKVAKGVEGLEEIDSRITPDFLRTWYLASKQEK